METTTKKWGWDTTSVTIPKLEKEQHYIIYFYYDYRTVNEKHLNLDETVIKKSYNKSYKLLTKTSKVLYAKDTYNATTKKYTKTNDKFYYNKKK